jgi:hypothetical protein
MYVWKSVCAALAVLAGASGHLAALQSPPPDDTPDAATEGPEESTTWLIDLDESVFAVVTQKAGFAARLAHNHLIVARDYTAHLELDPNRLDQTVFELQTLAPALVVDDPTERERWEARIVELGLVEELGSPGEDDREDIRKKMLSDEQLDAEEDPTISVSLLGVAPGEMMVGGVTFPYVADISVQVHGETVAQQIAADFRIEGGRIFLEAIGHFTFKAFGIEPYSAFMGSVKNKDEFMFYLNLQGVR